MKKAAIIHRQLIRENGLDAMMVGNIHDEIQLDTSEQDAEEVGRLGCESIRMAGEALKLKVPFTGSYKVGLTWADTH